MDIVVSNWIYCTNSSSQWSTDMVSTIFVISFIVYVFCVIVSINQWTPFTNGFKEHDGTYASKYYQVTCHVMRKAFIALLVGLGYVFYWFGGYIQLY